MTIPAAQLLRLLGAMPSAGASAGTRSAGVDSADFRALLDQARAGQVSSGAQVRVGKDAGVALDDEQLQRLAQAADIAEANGVGRAVFLIDGLAVTMDVATRTITGIATADKTSVLADMDAVVTVASKDAPAPPLIAAAPTSAGINPTLIEALARSSAA